MPANEKPARFTREIADLLASGANPDQILAFRPSKRAKARARELLDKMKANRISAEEEWELGEFEYAEMLMQLVKARIRSEKVLKS
jgi:hypothetical protein